ncbi:periplasmic binding protein [Methanocorpusculum labreanum Z]|uniref:Periplasmic binding protein n=1 Tax=Methanocorpusculum labreanum (strain ATCC 43576 / DSM 4855 / Z) TaxID=410358 RepID=A2SSF6_METLZ|nr:iron ABC transporter substrate-binding protein [Methanocorpusculum labreanum]ABN07262.1 periplasmic binding protein [Methanocorpusculum labreanum Z]
MRKIVTVLLLLALTLVCMSAGCVSTSEETGGGTITITDSGGRVVVVPDNPERIAVSGSGSTRYFAYLNVTDRLVAIDYQDSNLLNFPNDVRPYMLAHPEIKDLPALGTAKGVVDAEKLLSINPDILFMAGYSDTAIQSANEIQEKTGIPVVLFYAGDYVTNGDKVASSLKMIGNILHVDKRADDVIQYFADVRADLETRTAGIPDAEKPSVYVGGISYSGAHGLDGTDPTYYPFTVLHAMNVASVINATTSTGYAAISKEQILGWDPDIIFVDLGTMNAAGGGAIIELQTDPSYQELTAVKTGEVYAVNPHTSMGTNHETSMANAYYIGTILYPEQFADINPAEKANEIYTFIDGAPVYEQLKANLNNLSYTKLVV